MLTPEEITEEFVKMLEYYREKKGISQNKLATATGVTAGLLSRVKNGTRKAPALDKVWNIAYYLDMPLDELFTILKSKERGAENEEKRK